MHKLGVRELTVCQDMKAVGPTIQKPDIEITCYKMSDQFMYWGNLCIHTGNYLRFDKYKYVKVHLRRKLFDEPAKGNSQKNKGFSRY